MALDWCDIIDEQSKASDAKLQEMTPGHNINTRHNKRSGKTTNSTQDKASGQSTNITQDKASGQSTSITQDKASGQSTNITQDKASVQSTSITQDKASGQSTNITQDKASGQSTNITQDKASGQSTNITQDKASGQSTSITQDKASGQSTSITQDKASGQSTNITQDKASGQSTSITQDKASGQSTNITQDKASVQSTSITQDKASGQSTNITQDKASGQSTNITQDKASGQSTNITQDKASGQSTSITQDKASGQSTSITQDKASGQSTNITQDKASGQSTSITQDKASGQSTNITQDKASGQSTSITQDKASGQSTSITQDKASGQSTSITQDKASGQSTSITQDKASGQSMNKTQNKVASQNTSTTQNTPSDKNGDMSQVAVPRGSDSDITQSEKDPLEQFSLLLHIDLSRIRPNSNLHDVISEQILLDQGQNIQSLIDYMLKYPRKILLILDGWDKFNPAFCQDITDIANGERFPDSTVIITSRIMESTAMPKLHAFKCANATCVIKGFNLSQAKQFTEKIFQLIKFTASSDQLVKFVTDNHLWGVFSAPLLLTYLCLLHAAGSPLQVNVTDLFCSIIKLSLDRHKLKNMKKPAADVNVTMSDYQKQLSDIGKLAYLGLKKNNTKTVFSQAEAVKIGGEAILDLGLLHKVRSVSPLSPSCLVHFGHETIQEFLAAAYVCNDETAFSKFWQTMNSLGKVYIFELFITFVCGLNAQYGQELINKIQHMTDTTTVAQCPEISYTIEKTNKPVVGEITFGQRTTAPDVTSFLIQCCWETMQSDESVHSSRREEFPYKPVSTFPAIKLKPLIY